MKINNNALNYSKSLMSFKIKYQASCKIPFKSEQSNKMYISAQFYQKEKLDPANCEISCPVLY